MDLSSSMAYTYRQELTKFDYAVCLAAALGYLMIHQQDPVGLVTFDTRIQACLPPRSKRTQLGTILSVLANLKPSGKTDVAACLHQLAALVRNRSLIMLFSDLLTEPQPLIEGLHHPATAATTSSSSRHGRGGVHFLRWRHRVRGRRGATAGTRRAAYGDYLRRCRTSSSSTATSASGRIDYVPMDTSVSFDRATMEYLIQRQRRY
jgi:uncharacterized protein (DUF58 family)